MKTTVRRSAFALRCRVTGPRKGERPAALSIGRTPLAANRDGTFTLATSQIVDAFRKGYHVEPVRSSARATGRVAARKPARARSEYPDYVSEMFRAAARR